VALIGLSVLWAGSLAPPPQLAMAGRLATLAGQLLPRPVAGGAEAAVADWPPAPPNRPFAGFESPTGRQYPRGTVAALMGNMEPTMEESAGALCLIHGALPADLDGCYIRGGPNPTLNQFGSPTYHEFEGDGLMHACDLKEGSGSYRSRYISTRRRCIEQQRGKKIGIMEAAQKDGTLLGQANTSLVYHANKLLALYEVDKPYVISPADMSTEGQLTYDGRLKHSVTAHPKVCPDTGELVFFGYDMFAPMLHYGLADKEGNLVRSFDVPTQGKKPVMMHDMAITSRYSLLLEFPLYFDPKRAKEGNVPYVQDDASPTHFGILRRHAESAGEVRWFTGASAMSFHNANAWEDGDDVITLVGCRFEHFSFDYSKSSPSVLHEWKFDLKTGTTAERQLGDHHVEFPIVHPNLVGKRNRYVWASTFAGTGLPFHSINGVMKYDLQTGRELRHDFIGGRWGGESVFAPSKIGEEDSGYLLTYTYNPQNATTELYIVDARTMDPNPVAILQTPTRVPFGFHGVWLSRDKL